MFETSPSTLSLWGIEELLSIHGYPVHLLLALMWSPWGAEQKVFVQNNTAEDGYLFTSWRASFNLMLVFSTHSNLPQEAPTASFPRLQLSGGTCASQDGLLSLPQPKMSRETAAWNLRPRPTDVSAVNRRGLGACPLPYPSFRSCWDQLSDSIQELWLPRLRNH